jgi:hypothetical protein
MTLVLSLIGSLLLAGSLAIAAVGQSQGILEVRVKDHREAIGDFSKLTLTIGEILISPKPGLKFWQSGWKRLAVADQSVDLTKYVGKDSARIFHGSVETGSFDAIHLKLREVNGVLKKGLSNAQIKNSVAPIKLPFETRMGHETTIILDLVVLDLSDHPPRGYELGVKGYELYANGKLVDAVPPR